MKKAGMCSENRPGMCRAIRAVSAAAVLAAAVLSFSGSAGASDAHRSGTDDALILENAYGTIAFSEAEYRYCYESVIAQAAAAAGDYAAMLGLDLTRPLSEQNCTISQEEMSWEAYFIGQTSDMLTDMGVVVLESSAAGNAADRADAVEEEPETGETASREEEPETGETASGEEEPEAEAADHAAQRIAALSAAAQERLAHIRQEASFSTEDLEAYFREHLADFQSVTYLLAYVDGDGYEAGSAGSCVEQLEQAKSASAFEQLTKELTGAEVSRIENIRSAEMGNPEAEDVKWLLSDERSEGDLYTGQTGGNFFVLYYLARDDQGFGEDENGPWKTQAENALRDAACDTYLAQLREETQVETGPALARAVVRE